MGRVAILKEAYSLLPIKYNNFDYYNDDQALYALASSGHQMPGSAHALMFVKCIELMGTEEQKEKYLKKSVNFDIVGCYAQTELGHGSDVRSIQTTATFDEKTQ
jgi:acyl-CoA oxidase